MRQLSKGLSNDVLLPYQTQIESAIDLYLPNFGTKTQLLDACGYALMTGGKRLRPALVMMMAKALGQKGGVTFAALGIEFFHTASLIADDMPAMDDDEFRRGMPSVHKKFGEEMALLASYALIAAGYECIVINTREFKTKDVMSAERADRICYLALENATHNTGLRGATGGQFLDIAPPDLSESTLREIIHKKTSSLFEISFVYGWLFGGGDPEKLALVKEVASHFGLAFQIADDLGDMKQDLKNQRLVNVANVFGREVACRMFHEEHRLFSLKMNQLGISTEEFSPLLEKLKPE